MSLLLARGASAAGRNSGMYFALGSERMKRTTLPDCLISPQVKETWLNRTSWVETILPVAIAGIVVRAKSARAYLNMRRLLSCSGRKPGPDMTKVGRFLFLIKLVFDLYQT